MKKFLFQIGAFSLLLAVLYLGVFCLADGYTDAFYLRFTGPKQTSLVLGTSRAAQGVNPAVLNSVLQRKDLFNYSFSVAHSPYGAAYFESIGKKLDPLTRNGVFILTVDPWSISCESEDPDDSLHFREWDLAVGKTKMVNMYPNIAYLIQSYDQPYINLLLQKKDTTIRLHENGWLEISVPMDSLSVGRRTRQKIDHYKKNNLKNFKFSRLRMSNLAQSIYFLQKHGEVFLVRLPVRPEILDVENKYMPDFNEKLLLLSQKYGVKYKTFENSGDEYIYIDGNHLHKLSAKKVSREIGEWILQK